jgi:predicted DNA-binding transcriptional regulator AlpA
MKNSLTKKLLEPYNGLGITEAIKATKYSNSESRPTAPNPFEDILLKLSSIESTNNAILNKLSKLVNQDPEIGDIELAEKTTGYARQTIYQLVSAKKIPFIKKQGKLFFSKSDLIGWLLEGTKRTIEELAKDICVGKM